jgi:hypothetical protein
MSYDDNFDHMFADADVWFFLKKFQKSYLNIGFVKQNFAERIGISEVQSRFLALTYLI